MYRKFDVTGNLLFAQYFFLEVNTAEAGDRLRSRQNIREKEKGSRIIESGKK
jgi:hypothetical protein